MISLILIGLILFSFSYFMNNKALEDHTDEVVQESQETELDDALVDQ
jgi:hypothetical protein